MTIRFGKLTSCTSDELCGGNLRIQIRQDSGSRSGGSLSWRTSKARKPRQSAPMTPRGCIAQAWTVADEVLRAWVATE